MRLAPPAGDAYTARMKKITRVHDGIVGSIIAASCILSLTVSPLFLYLAVLTGLIMVSSTFTGFCPIYFALGKVMSPNE